MERCIRFSILVFVPVLLLWCLKKTGRKNRIPAMITFFIYLFGFLYYTLFSREPTQAAQVSIIPLKAFRQTFTFDSGFLHVMKVILQDGIEQGFDKIHIERTEPLINVVLNTLLFIPLGYLVPVLCRRCCGFFRIFFGGIAISFLLETIQLLTRLGWFDVDDILYNSIGIVVGFVIYKLLLREVE